MDGTIVGAGLDRPETPNPPPHLKKRRRERIHPLRNPKPTAAENRMRQSECMNAFPTASNRVRCKRAGKPRPYRISRFGDVGNAFMHSAVMCRFCGTDESVPYRKNGKSRRAHSCSRRFQGNSTAAPNGSATWAVPYFTFPKNLVYYWYTILVKLWNLGDAYVRQTPGGGEPL